MKPQKLTLLLCAFLFVCCGGERKSYTDYVDLRIGSGGHGHVFVGADVPFGMVQLGPTSIPEQWDWCSGYHDSDSTVIGFSHTHLSGTGIGDLFDITVMPVVGQVRYARGNEDEPESGLWSYGARSEEIARPGYYSIPLLRYGIKAELTATCRVGMHRYTFPCSDEAAIVFDLENGGCWDKATGTFVERCGDNAIRGHRYSSGWAKDQRIYFYAEFSKPIEDFEVVQSPNKDGMQLPLYARASFRTLEGEQVLLKVALSPVSMDGARANMQAELPLWDFDAVARDADRLWNSELSKIKVESKDEESLVKFYTALFHTMIAPAVFCDADGSYRGADSAIHGNPGHETYTIFSLWDTYRAAMPLYSIFQTERYVDFINTMVDICDEQGKLPVWHLHGCETDCMVGNPGIPPVADAIVKGLGGFNTRAAYQAMKISAMRADRGQDLRMKHGYIPCDLFGESVAYDLEYALADASIALAARKMASDYPENAAEYEADAEYFSNRSQSWRKLFDPSLGFIRGKDSKGNFRKEYSPFSSSHRADDYCEGNGWQYTWLVPHDFNGLCESFGGKEKLLEKLDSLFTVSSVVEGEETSPDISGLIGQYAHGNEPSHHILYFYTIAGQPWKTADRVRQVVSELYHAAPDGLSGNEDVGQMSAWYILSNLGFYEVEPGSGRYWFGTPLMDRAEIEVPGGTFTIIARELSDKNRYVQKVFLNGKAYTKAYIPHSDIAAGGELLFEMGPEPKVWYCAREPQVYADRRPVASERLFVSPAVEKDIERVCGLLENPRLRWMFANCYPNTLDTTVHISDDKDGEPDTFVYTGDIPAMWLRDSGAQVWPYLRYVNEDESLRRMIAGVINRQFRCICTDPYANAFNVEPIGAANKTDWPEADPYVFERKWEIDSHCYPIRLAYGYWKTSGDESVFGDIWVEAMGKILATMKEQQRKEGHGSYVFLRTTDRQLDTKCVVGRGNPVKGCGLIASSFRPSDDATTFEYLIPSNFMAVSSLRKAAEILEKVNGRGDMALECRNLADEVARALKREAICHHPVYGDIYAFETDGFGNRYIMDDANVPSLLAMSYLGDVPAEDPVYRNTREFVWSDANPYFFRGAAGEGIGGPHIGQEAIWPMSIMMRAFTSDDEDEIRDCICSLMTTDAGTGFIHESFHRNNSESFTREWFAWQNTLFGELILKIIDDGRLHILNEII